jgi:tetrahydromethanopterin S-methyltransferase subunit G
MEPEFGRSGRIGDRLGEFEKRLENRLCEFERRLCEFERRLGEQLRDMQTELLKAFLPWQEQIRIQFRELEANTGNSVVAVKQRMDVMERRLGEIEKRLFLYPPAA